MFEHRVAALQGKEYMKANDLFSMAGRRVFISGASSGIGRHMAKTFAKAGAAVALGARRTDKLHAAVEELQAQGYAAIAVFLDVTKPESITAAFDEAEKSLGGTMDVLFNNAGIIYVERFVDQTADEIGRVFDTNIKGVFLVAQEAARRMATARQGAIINVASTAGLRAAGFLSSYAASKASVIHAGKVMALELSAANIRVNTLCPGNIETDMQGPLADKGFEATLIRKTPMRRFGKCEDLDGAALLLASDAGRYITGACLTVDGGQALTWM